MCIKHGSIGSEFLQSETSGRIQTRTLRRSSSKNVKVEIFNILDIPPRPAADTFRTTKNASDSVPSGVHTVINPAVMCENFLFIVLHVPDGVDDFLSETDLNNDGYVTYHEFKIMMSQTTRTRNKRQ